MNVWARIFWGFYLGWVLMVVAFSVPFSGRVIGAWMVWARLRWVWRRRSRRVHRWLWLRTLHQANGTRPRRR